MHAINYVLGLDGDTYWHLNIHFYEQHFSDSLLLLPDSFIIGTAVRQFH